VAKIRQHELFGRADEPAPVQVPAGDGAAVREVRCKSLLNTGGIDDYSFNCYTGCSHGCVYCYARFMQRFHPHDEPWGKFVDVKINATEVLARQLRRARPGAVFTCSACDGWQSVERHYKLTRKCCRMLLEAGFRLNVLTKSELVLRDLDVLRGGDVCLGVTITTPDEAQARLWEPRASSVAARWDILRRAKQAGLETSVMFGPLLPGISDTPDALTQLLKTAAEIGVDRVWTDAINLRPRVWPSVRQFLARNRPDLLGLYKAVLFNSTYREDYLGRLRERIGKVASQAGLAGVCGGL